MIEEVENEEDAITSSINNSNSNKNSILEKNESKEKEENNLV